MNALAEMLRSRGLETEFKFATSRSSGAGGQNVNKVNTRVEIRFHVENSALLMPEEKSLILEKLASQVSNDGFLIVSAQSARSQLQNRDDAVSKLFRLLASGLSRPKKRKSTSPTRQSKEKRLESKRQHSVKKELRKRIE